jgi:hypothetical protein
LERRIFENQSDFTEFKQRAGIFTGNADSLQMDSFPSISQLLSIAGTSISVVPPSVAKEQVQAELATLEAEMQQRENRNYLNFIQFKYSGNAKDELPNRFLVGVGFRFPWLNTSKLRQQEKELQALEAKADAEAESLSASRAALAKLRELTRLVQSYNFTQDQKARFIEQYSPKQLHAAGLENPETLLRVEISIQKLDAEIFSIEKDVYKAYLDLLGETGLLTAEPSRNYLSPSLELIPR